MVPDGKVNQDPTPLVMLLRPIMLMGTEIVAMDRPVDTAQVPGTPRIETVTLNDQAIPIVQVILIDQATQVDQVIPIDKVITMVEAIHRVALGPHPLVTEDTKRTCKIVLKI